MSSEETLIQWHKYSKFRLYCVSIVNKVLKRESFKATGCDQGAIVILNHGDLISNKGVFEAGLRSEEVVEVSLRSEEVVEVRLGSGEVVEVSLHRLMSWRSRGE